MEPKQKVVLTALQAQKKAENYCVYQERSQQEVRDKLYSWGLYPPEVENILTELIINDFINEERFAKSYVSGKFKIKHWGRLKIKQGLIFKKISPKMIHKALALIDNEEHVKCLTYILEKKAATLKEKDSYKRKMKLANFASGKGYENDSIFDILNNKDL